jgi:two-component system, OmpR family, KDP operon response regulator KdpE
LESDAQSLRVFMANIRRELEIDPTKPRYIITEEGIGYHFADE